MAKGSILIVDDEAELCEFLTFYLSSKGFDTDFALNGPDALEKISLRKPHLILLDLKMPEMDGIEVLRRVKEMDKNIGVIIVTGVDDQLIGKKTLEMGASDFIVKPFRLDYLETSVLAKIVGMLA